MNWVRPCTILTALLLGACGGMPDCQKPQLYQEAVPGKRIELLDGMDNLSAARELTIPEASPTHRRPRANASMHHQRCAPRAMKGRMAPRQRRD
ncbi:MAG: hypothetical protein U5K38_18450 [Woeseiaceae bacterium]|nr:hypothetical protein [Woeseiaceae bacterium]